jgi:hypothetical protein
MTPKLKYLQDIQLLVNNCEMISAQKKLLRYQGLFKFREGDKGSTLYYSILHQIGSYKLLQKLILPKLNLKMLNREKIDTKLRSMKISINYTRGRYFYSIIFLSDFVIGDQLLFIKRCSGNSLFSAGEVSSLLGLKKSRTNEYLRNWVATERLKVAKLDGNQKIYQIIAPLISIAI